MSSLLPPAERIWWKEPIEGVELFWVAIALVWAIVMFIMMPYWHVYGKQNLSNEAYRTSTELYGKKVQAMVDQYTVRKETARDMPVVHPPAGADVYLLRGCGSGIRSWNWNRARLPLHLSSMDWQHGFSLQPENINVQVIPGYEMVIKITPNKSGEYTVVCNEYCGIGHHAMTAEST